MNTNRYEVINTMPHFTHLFKGDILVPKHHALAGDCWGREDEDNVQKWVTFCPDFPHLFRMLKWWEHVPVEELPKYVKWGSGNSVHVHKIESYEFTAIFANVYANTNEGESLLLSDCDHPATEAEYTDYLTKLNSK